MSYDDLVPHTPGHRVQGVTPEDSHESQENDGLGRGALRRGCSDQLPTEERDGSRQRDRGRTGSQRVVDKEGQGDLIILACLCGKAPFVHGKMDPRVRCEDPECAMAVPPILTLKRWNEIMGTMRKIDRASYLRGYNEGWENKRMGFDKCADRFAPREES